MNSADKVNYLTLILQIILIALVVYSSFLQSRTQDNWTEPFSVFSGTAAVIPVKGEIMVDRYTADWDLTASEEIVPMIEKADKDPSIKAIILDINSVGGSLVASDEIARAIKNTNKTTVAWIRQSGTSAAYHIASAADWIIANSGSNAGGIGVITQYEITDATYETVKAGKYKDILINNRLLTEEERKIAQEQTDFLHQLFIQDVANNRNMELEAVEELANGLSWPGATAKELGLVDELGSKEEVLRHIQKQIGEEPVLVYYDKERHAFDLEYPKTEDAENI